MSLPATTAPTHPRHPLPAGHVLWRRLRRHRLLCAVRLRVPRTSETCAAGTRSLRVVVTSLLLMHPALEGQPHEPARPLNKPPAPLPFSAVQPAGDSLIDATSTDCQPPTFCPLSPDVQYNPGDFLIDVTSMDYRSPELEASTRQRCGGGRLAACRGRRVGGMCMGVLAGSHKRSACGLVERKQAALAWPVLARTHSPCCSVSILPARPVWSCWASCTRGGGARCRAPSPWTRQVGAAALRWECGVC